MIRDIEDGGRRFRIDTTLQVLGLECPEDVSYERDDALKPSISALGPAQFVSASVLAAKAKAFDDGLIAAVDLAAQTGAGRFEGKASLLAKLPGDIASAARHLGTGAAATPVAANLVQKFLGDERLSKPLGFYTWSPELERIFRQDRMMQTEFAGEADFAAAVRALHASPELRLAYEAWMSLNERLTNPFTRPDLRSALRALDRGEPLSFQRGVAWAPPSESVEGALVKRLFANRPIPDGFNLAYKLIEEIRKGAVTLTPSANSGWYDRIAWSLLTLVAPESGDEARKLDLGEEYRKTLEQLFKGILALARESHVKQLEAPSTGSGMPAFRLKPDLSVEPLPTHYLRRALGYRFVREVLESTFGAGTLRELKRLTVGGPVKATLDEELALMEGLFLGAHATACAEIGLPPQTGIESQPRFQEWREGLAADVDLANDNRMMVPVFFDLQRKQMKVWAFLGWTSRPLQARFKVPPKVEVLAWPTKKSWFGFAKAPPPPRVEFGSARFALTYPVTAEVYTSKLMNREEFRAHCDRFRTEKAILENLR